MGGAQCFTNNFIHMKKLKKQSKMRSAEELQMIHSRYFHNEKSPRGTYTPTPVEEMKREQKRHAKFGIMVWPSKNIAHYIAPDKYSAHFSQKNSKGTFRGNVRATFIDIKVNNR